MNSINNQFVRNKRNIFWFSLVTLMQVTLLNDYFIETEGVLKIEPIYLILSVTSLMVFSILPYIYKATIINNKKLQSFKKAGYLDSPLNVLGFGLGISVIVVLLFILSYFISYPMKEAILTTANRLLLYMLLSLGLSFVDILNTLKIISK